MAERVRIGIVGAGANTRDKHIPGFKAISGVELVAVSNRSMESGRKVAGQFGISRAVENWREVVEAPDVDAVCIGTWPNMHARVATAALAAGKHVLTEARMARNLAEAEAMLAESQAHPDLVAQIVPAPMSLPFDAVIRRMLEHDQIGELREACLVNTGAASADPHSPLTWRQDFALSGKNTMTLGIYYEMLLRWLAREPESLVAEAAIFTAERRDPEGAPQQIQIPESVTVLGTYTGGARLIAHFSGVESGSPRGEARLNGSKGSIRLDVLRGELWYAPVGGAEQRIEPAAGERGGWRVEADFIDSIREKKPVRLTDFATGVRYMRFTEAVWDSWNAGGQRIHL